MPNIPTEPLYVIRSFKFIPVIIRLTNNTANYQPDLIIIISDTELHTAECTERCIKRFYLYTSLLFRVDSHSFKLTLLRITKMQAWAILFLAVCSVSDISISGQLISKMWWIAYHITIPLCANGALEIIFTNNESHSLFNSHIERELVKLFILLPLLIIGSLILIIN